MEHMEDFCNETQPNNPDGHVAALGKNGKNNEILNKVE